MKRTNFIKLFRAITEWEHYKDCYAKSLFIHFLVCASAKDTTFLGVRIKKGQYLSSVDQLVHETGISVKRILKAIETLKQSGEIMTERCGGNLGTLYTVTNYDKYQASEKIEKKQDNRPKGGNGLG